MPPKPHPRTRAKQPANYTPLTFQGPETKQQTKAPILNVSRNQILPKDEGIRVLMSLKPKKKARFVVFQNIDTRLGTDRYVYSEAWTLNTDKKQYDYFQVPKERRNERHKVIAEMWLEPGGIPKNYKTGKLGREPWGTTHGFKERRTPPDGTPMLRRETSLRWDRNGKMLPVQDKRKIVVFAG